MRPTADSRSCRSQARWTGVCPEGAQVRRRTGWSMKPLSSKKTIGLPQRLAPFLSAANPASATAPWPRRLLLGPVVRASGRSIPGRGAFSRRDPGDTPRGTSWRSPRLPDGRSKGRWGIPPSVARPRGSRSGAAFASRSNGACGQDVVWLVTPPGLLSPQPGATVSPKTPKHQRFPPPRRHRRPPAANALPAVGEPPMRLRFLSVSYLTIRMSTTLGSLALQGSIVRIRRWFPTYEREQVARRFGQACSPAQPTKTHGVSRARAARQPDGGTGTGCRTRRRRLEDELGMPC